MNAATSLLIAYGIGCISFALLVARLRGVDLRAQGSGNPGATNVGRVLGRRWGGVVLVLDILKGVVPVAWLAAPPSELGLPQEVVPLVVDARGRTLLLSAVVLGHVYPITGLMRGGKGVATLIGGALAFSPLAGLVGIGTHLVVKKGLGFVSAASVALAWSLPATQLARGAVSGWQAASGVGVLGALAVLVTWRHRDNFTRIREGTEDRYHDADPAVRDSSEQHGESRNPR